MRRKTVCEKDCLNYQDSTIEHLLFLQLNKPL
jgi:hypothetical protein